MSPETDRAEALGDAQGHAEAGAVEALGDDVLRPRRGAEIRAYPDGPFLVRGPVTIVDGNGREVHVRRRVVALCRCGRSRRQPLCDGTHTAAGFTCTGTSTANGAAPTLDLRAHPDGR